jgi:hypothetical protein
MLNLNELTGFQAAPATKQMRDAADANTIRPGPVNGNQDSVGAMIASALVFHQKGCPVEFDISVSQAEGKVCYRHRRDEEGRLESNVSFESNKQAAAQQD